WNRAAPEDLPEAGATGLEAQAAACPVLDELVLVEDQRPRSDEAHLPAHDVEQLRQLVERMPAQPPPDPGDTRVVRHLEHPSVAAVLGMAVEVRDLVLPGVR